MKKKQFKHIYGPVSSWRLGRSLGVDLLSGRKKFCTFDCIYCQLGSTRSIPPKRRVFVPTLKIVQEIKALPKVRIDYITFSGCGEPALARNLGQTIQEIKKLRREPVAVLTNATLLYRKDVREELALADLVIVKIDADSEELFRLINRPSKEIKFTATLRGIRQFRKEFKGKMALQIMFIPENEMAAGRISVLVKKLKPDEVQICTPLRPCAVCALSRDDINKIKKYFRDVKVITCYDARRKKVKPINKKAVAKRRGSVE